MNGNEIIGRFMTNLKLQLILPINETGIKSKFVSRLITGQFFQFDWLYQS